MNRWDRRKLVSIILAGIIVLGLVIWSACANAYDVTTPWTPPNLKAEWFQVVIGIGGLVGLWWTVVFARRAWLESRRSADEAKRSADAAYEALSDTRNDSAEQANRFQQQLAVATAANENFVASSERQLRAYVSAKPTSFRLNANMKAPFPAVVTVSFKVLAKNHGKTPAYKTQVWANIVYVGWPVAEDFWQQFKEALSHNSVINPGHEVEFSFAKEITFDENGLYETSPKRIALYGVIRYEDAFGQPRFTRFSGSLVNLREWWLKARNEQIVDVIFEHSHELDPAN